MASRAGNLPASFTTFVGRRREVAEVCRRLGTTRLLTLTGVGGIGKTRLALEAATAAATAFPDGVWLVDLAPVRRPSAVASTAATALGVPDLGSRPVLEQLGKHLAGRRALLVLDNCEHLVDASAELAKTLLQAAAGVRVLATSRQMLGIVGEHVYTVPPLLPEDAVELLRDRTTAVRPEFRITDANTTEVSRLCADLDGLPLAIELAASRLRTLTVEQVADRLADRFALLSGGCRTALPRQRTLRAAIEWSHDLCTPAERLLWNRLSVFDGSFGLDAAEDICSGEGIARRDILDLLDRLVAQSVVLPIEADGLLRYHLLETIRQYGRERLAVSGEEDRLRARHRDCFLALAEQLADSWCGPGQAEGLARLRAEHTNLRKALDYDADPQATLALTAALRFHWCVGGFLGEGRRQLERALAAAPAPTPPRARALWAAAWAAILQGDLEVAERWLDEAAELGRQLDDPVVRAYVLGLRGMLAGFRGQLEEAVSLHEAAATAHTALREGPGAIAALFQLTFVQSRPGDSRAAESGRQAVALAETHGERWGRAYALWALGRDAWVHDDREASAALTRAALDAQQGFNDYVATALMLEVLAWTTAAGGDHERAGRLLGAVRSLLKKIGSAIPAFGPHLAQDHALCQETIEGALGPAAYEKALADGGKHDTPARAIAYALGAELAAAAPGPLTRRESEVAALVAQGRSNRQIASTLGRSPRTVDMHVQNILAKLGFGSRAQIAAWWTANQALAH
uniref:LuxR C-terminal-related transcriptional regulator n=1 Tax=Streptomyces sp. NBC_00093 TaxID=2975649 RepID=A0AAU2AH17_9ACTN